MMLKIVAAVVLLFVVTQAAVPGDEVKHLPGLSKQPSWKHYSGYLQASGTRKLHYWFVESMSSTPKDDPVVLWLNGGPGCSSLLGMFTENGPFRINPADQNIIYNPHSWSKIANVLFLESPAGVGFSYSDDKNYTTDDIETAHNNYLALKDFFSKYPEYSSNEFFVTGESYGGIYVPTLSSLVVDDKDINFKGFAVGNGLMDGRMLENSLIYFAYYHGIVGDDTWGDLMDNCCKGQERRCDFMDSSLNNTQCKKALFDVFNALSGSLLNEYNLYGECINTPNSLSYDAKTDMYTSSNYGWYLPHSPKTQHQRQFIKNLPPNKLRMTPPCLNETDIHDYLRRDDVREAIHIPSIVPRWDSCSGPVSQSYKGNFETMKPQYTKVLAANKRILVYNGDVDMACNFLGDEWFVDSLTLEKVNARKPWYYTAADQTKQNAGFVQEFKQLTFVTVRGSGHMVPTDRPEPALVMFTNFIQNKPF